jgi:hypothetical protein
VDPSPVAAERAARRPGSPPAPLRARHPTAPVPPDRDGRPDAKGGRSRSHAEGAGRAVRGVGAPVRAGGGDARPRRARPCPRPKPRTAWRPASSTARPSSACSTGSCCPSCTPGGCGSARPLLSPGATCNRGNTPGRPGARAAGRAGRWRHTARAGRRGRCSCRPASGASSRPSASDSPLLRTALRCTSPAWGAGWRCRPPGGRSTPRRGGRGLPTGKGGESPHWLRHAHATHATEQDGAGVHLVQATLGYASVATTSTDLHARPDDSSALHLGL